MNWDAYDKLPDAWKGEVWAGVEEVVEMTGDEEPQRDD